MCERETRNSSKKKVSEKGILPVSKEKPDFVIHICEKKERGLQK